MRFILLSAILLFSLPSISQIDGPINPNQSANDTVVNAPLVCRDPKYMMVLDCAEKLYVEPRMIGERSMDVVFHQKSGKPYTGTCKLCHNNGNLWMYLEYMNGFSVGIDTIYHENGNINLIRSHDTQGLGMEDGTWKMFDENGTIMWEKSYVMGAEDGESRYYFPDTSIWKIEHWKVGKLDGVKQEYYPNSPNHQMKKEVNYKDGKFHGKYITYFEDGKVESEQQYKMGKKDGLSRYYYPSGDLFYQESHSNGCRDGETKRFYFRKTQKEEGVIGDNRKWTVENYKGDKRHGIFEEYYDDDKNNLKYKATYKNGKLEEEQYFNEFGEPIDPPEDTNETFKTSTDKENEENWPENPTDEWLEEKNFKDRSQYEKERKKYLKSQSKDQKEQQKDMRCG